MSRILQANLTLLALLLAGAVLGVVPAASADGSLPPIVFVARSRLATADYLFPRELGPAGQLTTGLSKFAPGSKLIVRERDGRLRTLLDTARPPGDPLNPLGLQDVQSPDVSFDATRIVFSASFGPVVPGGRATTRPWMSWRLFEIGVDGSGLRQLTFSDRSLTIPEGPGNAEAYGGYDDLFPAYLADGRIAFSSSRYPARAHYDGRPAFNLYVVDGTGRQMRRITTERTAALHPAPLPDGRIVFSRWWVNFNQPSERGVYSRIDNADGDEVVRDQSGRVVTVERRVEIVETVVVPPAQPALPPTPAATATPKPLSFVERLDPATGGIVRVTKTPAPATPTPRVLPTATPAPQGDVRTIRRTEVVEQPLTGHRLPDGTLVYANTETTFNPARGRLADGFPIRDAPNTWHLMAIGVDGSGMQRLAWTPRYDSLLTDDDGLDTYNAAQPAPVLAGGELLLAYTTQRDQTMAHTTLYTGIRVARPGLEHLADNTTESIAGYRWEGEGFRPPYALAPAGLPDGRILYSQTAERRAAARSGSYAFTQDGQRLTLRLQSSDLRYELWAILPDGTQGQAVGLDGLPDEFDAMEAAPLVVRPVGLGPGEWRAPQGLAPPVTDDPTESNVPFGLLDADGRAAYPWSVRPIERIGAIEVRNANVYANPPLERPFANNSPPLGSVAYADIYIDANQFGGATPRAARPDDQVRAVKWLTVPVAPDGSFRASAPADVPMFVVLRDRDGRIVRGGNRHTLSIAQGNSPGQPGRAMHCVGCHMGHASGSLDGQTLAAFGWTNVAPAAAIAVSSSAEEGGAARLNDRRGYVAAPRGSGVFHDRTAPWLASGGAGEWARLEWQLPIAVLEVRLVGAEPGQGGMPADHRVSGELRFFLRGVEVPGTAQTLSVAPLTAGGSRVRLDRPVAADRVVFTVTDVQGGAAALSEIEVIGQGATPAALESRPGVVVLPALGR